MRHNIIILILVCWLIALFILAALTLVDDTNAPPVDPTPTREVGYQGE